MIARRRNVILTLLLSTYIILAIADAVQSQENLKRKIDAFFMIASSAELKVRDQVEPAKDSIAAIGVDAVPILVDKLTTQSARERWTVIQILKKIGSPAVPYLIRSLNNPKGLVVERVCWALGDIGDSSAVGALMEVTSHRRWQVRDEAFGALGDIGSARAADAVRFGFNDSVGQVRKSAVVAAGKIRVGEAIRELVGMLGDDFYGARLSAFDALLMLDTTAVVAAIADSMNSGNNLVGDLGCQVLGRLGTDRALEILMPQTRADAYSRRAHAAVAVIEADPLDNCGYRQGIIEKESDSLVLLRIHSAIYSTQNARQTSEK